MNRRANGRGRYFGHMVMYGRGPCDGNQLEWILSQFNSRSGVLRSRLQAATFDPERDHGASARHDFPCLQQLSFEPTPAGLVISAFYATQQIFDKAYGNYLGLGQPGAFMAHEMGMPLARPNVMVGLPSSNGSPRAMPILRHWSPLPRRSARRQKLRHRAATHRRDGRWGGALKSKPSESTVKRLPGRPTAPNRCGERIIAVGSAHCTAVYKRAEPRRRYGAEFIRIARGARPLRACRG